MDNSTRPFAVDGTETATALRTRFCGNGYGNGDGRTET